MKKFLLIIMIMLTVALPAWAEEKTISLDEVVVTATRAEEDIDKISSNITVITQEEIKKSTATTVQDLLRNEEGIIVRDLYGTGTKSTVDMRGFSRGLNTAILIDGRKLNEIDLSGVDWNTIPMENIERIEIVRGSQSVLYGDNAMAGAINIITKKGQVMNPEFMLEAKAESYSGHTELGTLTGGTDKIGYFFFLKHRQTSGYRENSDFTSADMSARLNFKVTDNLSFDFAAGYHTDDQGLPGGLTEAQLKDDRRQSVKPDDQVGYDQRYIDTKANLALGDWGDLEIGYSHNNRKFDSDLFYFGSVYNTKRDTSISGMRAKLTAETRPLNFRNLAVAGIDFDDAKVSNISTSSSSSTDSDIKKQEIGLYLQDELFVTDKISFSLGYRYSDARFTNRSSGFTSVAARQDFTEDAFRAGATLNYAKGSRVFINYSRGYRLPTTDEIFDFSGIITDLKPETSDTYETGVVHAFGKDLQARLTLYMMDIRNELFFNPTGGGGFGANENLDKTRHYGVETGVSASLTDAVSVFCNLTYADARFRSGPYDDNHIQLVPNLSASIGADYRFLRSFLLAADANWVGKKYLDNDVDNSFDKAESYTVVNARLSYTYKNITAYAGVKNIFNDKFSEYSIVGFGGNKNFYPAPERNFYGGLRITL